MKFQKLTTDQLEKAINNNSSIDFNILIALHIFGYCPHYYTTSMASLYFCATCGIRIPHNESKGILKIVSEDFTSASIAINKLAERDIKIRFTYTNSQSEILSEIVFTKNNKIILQLKTNLGLAKSLFIAILKLLIAENLDLSKK